MQQDERMSVHQVRQQLKGRRLWAHLTIDPGRNLSQAQLEASPSVNTVTQYKKQKSFPRMPWILCSLDQTQKFVGASEGRHR